MLDSNTHFQAGAWEQGRSPVGRVALIPTLIYLLKYMVVQWKFLCQLLINMKHLFYACLCRDEGNPTYGFFKLYHFNLSPFGFDGVVRGLHPTKLYFLPILFFFERYIKELKIQN